MAQHKLSSVCIKKRCVKSTYYSDTYRAKFTISGINRIWDVTHISIPFEREKEESLLKKFEIKREDLPSFYENLKVHIKKEIDLLKKLSDLNDENIKNNIIEYVYTDIYEEEQNTSFYLVSYPHSPIIGSAYIKENEVTLLNLVNLSLRFAQYLKILHGQNIYIGAFDFETIYMLQTEDKNILKLGSLLYAQENADIKGVLRTAPSTMHENIKKGTSMSVESDIFMLASLMLSILQGKNYTEKPDDNTDLKNIPVELKELLESCINGEILDAKEFYKRLQVVRKKLLSKEYEDILISFSKTKELKPEYQEETEIEKLPDNKEENEEFLSEEEYIIEVQEEETIEKTSEKSEVLNETPKPKRESSFEPEDEKIEAREEDEKKEVVSEISKSIAENVTATETVKEESPSASKNEDVEEKTEKKTEKKEISPLPSAKEDSKIVDSIEAEDIATESNQFLNYPAAHSFLGSRTIGIFSVSSGAGSTYMTISLAETFAKKRLKVAAVSFDGKADFDCIGEGFAEYFAPPLSRRKAVLTRVLSAGYDYVFIDFGTPFAILPTGMLEAGNLFEKNIEVEELLRCFYKIGISFPETWHMGKLSYFENSPVFSSNTLFSVKDYHSIRKKYKGSLSICDRDVNEISKILFKAEGIR